MASVHKPHIQKSVLEPFTLLRYCAGHKGSQVTGYVLCRTRAHNLRRERHVNNQLQCLLMIPVKEVRAKLFENTREGHGVREGTGEETVLVLRPEEQVAVCRQMERRWRWGIPGKGSSIYGTRRHRGFHVSGNLWMSRIVGSRGSSLVEEKARGVSNEEKERARLKGMHD